MNRLLIIPCLVLVLNTCAQSSGIKVDSLSNTVDNKYCTSRVINQSPAKLFGIGFDHQFAYDLTSDTIHTKDYSDSIWYPQKTSFAGSGGLRAFANVPIIVKDNIILQVGFNYIRNAYSKSKSTSNTPKHPLNESLAQRGLRTFGLHSTLFKPINDKNFIVAQIAADLNGDYDFNNLLPLRQMRISGACIFGWKKNDRKMIGFGISRNFRAGQLGYIPVMLLNWTAYNKKWGVEILAPARVQIRKNINSRNLIMLGYELEGQSYFLMNGESYNNKIPHLELRRSELRFRLTYERFLHKYIWLTAQSGFRYNYLFDADSITGSDKTIRGFTNNQPYTLENNLSNTFYFLISVNVVSP